MDSTDISSELEIGYLKEKIEAGADFVLTQLFYDVDGFLAWEKQCRALGITCPIIPGIMPIQSYNGFRRITNLAKIRVPADVAAALEPIQVRNNPSGCIFLYERSSTVELMTGLSLFTSLLERRPEGEGLWCTVGGKNDPAALGRRDHRFPHLHSEPRKVCSPHSGTCRFCSTSSLDTQVSQCTNSCQH
jgi:hypothetical protein